MRAYRLARTDPWWWDAEDALEFDYDDPAFALWAWVRASSTWTPEDTISIEELRESNPNLADFIEAILEIVPRSALAAYKAAGCTWLEARAHELKMRGQSYQSIADLLGCRRKTAETHVRRATNKLKLVRHLAEN